MVGAWCILVRPMWCRFQCGQCALYTDRTGDHCSLDFLLCSVSDTQNAPVAQTECPHTGATCTTCGQCAGVAGALINHTGKTLLWGSVKLKPALHDSSFYQNRVIINGWICLHGVLD